MFAVAEQYILPIWCSIVGLLVFMYCCKINLGSSGFIKQRSLCISTSLIIYGICQMLFVFNMLFDIDEISTFVHITYSSHMFMQYISFLFIISVEYQLQRISFIFIVVVCGIVSAFHCYGCLSVNMEHLKWTPIHSDKDTVYITSISISFWLVLGFELVFFGVVWMKYLRYLTSNNKLFMLFVIVIIVGFIANLCAGVLIHYQLFGNWVYGHVVSFGYTGKQIVQIIFINYISDKMEIKTNKNKYVNISLGKIVSKNENVKPSSLCSIDIHSRNNQTDKPDPASLNKIKPEIICDNFIELFRKYLKYEHKNDQFEIKGKYIMRENILYWIQNNKPISCILPAFPFKSTNLDKVLSDHCDYGEYLAIQRLYEFAKQVDTFYKYGCRIIIISDGRVYADLVGISYDAVKLFHNEVCDLIKEIGNGYILWSDVKKEILRYKNINDNYNNNDQQLKTNPIESDFDIGTDIRDDDTIPVLMKLFPVTLEDVELLIKNDPNIRNVYVAFTRFMEYELAPWHGTLDSNGNQIQTRNGIIRYCKKTVSKPMIGRGKAYSQILSENYPNHIRFSIHGHDNSIKFPVRFFPDLPYCITPWHGVICKMLDGRNLIMKHAVIKEIIKQQSVGEYDQKQEEDDHKNEVHVVDIKHKAEFKKIASKFDEWSEIDLDKIHSFKLISKNNIPYYYAEVIHYK